MQLRKPTMQWVTPQGWSIELIHERDLGNIPYGCVMVNTTGQLATVGRDPMFDLDPWNDEGYLTWGLVRDTGVSDVYDQELD